MLTVQFLKIFPNHENRSKNSSFDDMLLCAVTIKGFFFLSPLEFKYLHVKKKCWRETGEQEATMIQKQGNEGQESHQRH